jgi:hypothetical protein
MTKTRISALAAFLAAAFLVPSLASAEPDGASDRPAEAPPGRPAKGKRGDLAKHFPMAGDEFVARVDKRIDKFGAKLEARLAEAKRLTDEQKDGIRADFAKGSAAIKDAASKAAADGTVTLEEAKKVREVAQRIRDKAREKYGHGKGPKGNKGNKGKGPKRGPRADDDASARD